MNGKKTATLATMQKQRSRAFDIAVAVGLWVLSVAALFVFNPSSLDLRSLAILGAFSGILTLPLLFRRTHTVGMGIAMVAIFIVQAVVQFPLIPANVSLVVVVHALARYAPRWASLAGLVTAYVGAILAFLIYDYMLFIGGMSVLMRVMVWLLTVALITSAWLLGNVQRSRRALVNELTERARRLEFEQEQERALAAADERARIAREMHDIVAHSLSVIITQADGASYAAKTRPEIAVNTLHTISGAARESLGEMRRLLGVLRHDDTAAMGPTPDIALLPTLVQEVEAAGLPVTLTGTEEANSKHRLPKGAELAVYRVVQESLTNVLKHGGPLASAQVVLEWEPSGLMIEVTDDGRGAGADPPSDGAGQGIRGMQERVALYGGSVVAQAKLGGGFAVHAWIPFMEA